MPSSNHRIVVLSVALAGLVGLAYLAYSGFRPSDGPVDVVKAPAPPAMPAGPPVGVETAQVLTADLTDDALAVGSLRSNESVVVRPETAGRIAAIHFRDGAAVGKGMLLIALDAATQAAELEQARANLALARASFQRTQDLFVKKFISGQALDTAQATLKVQEAAVALAQAKFDKMRISAPFAGMVGIRNISVGDYVKEGQDLINLEDIRTLKVDFRLPELYLGQVRPGQSLEVSSDALPGQVFAATLEAINPLVDAGGRAVALRARLQNAEVRLRPGMFVRVRLILDQRRNVLSIPEQAIVPDSRAPYVYRVVEGRAQRVPIKSGLRRDARVEIVEGLHAGDEIVTAGQLKLRDGVPVRPANADASSKAATAGAGGSSTAGPPTASDSKPSVAKAAGR